MTLEKLFNGKTAIEILRIYDFPKRFVAYFLSQITDQEMLKHKNFDSRLLKAVEIAQRFGNGEDFSKEELEKVRISVESHYYSCPIYIMYPAICAYNAIAFCMPYSEFLPSDYLSHYHSELNKPLLLELIKTRMTKLEKLVTFGEEENLGIFGRLTRIFRAVKK